MDGGWAQVDLSGGKMAARAALARQTRWAGQQAFLTCYVAVISDRDQAPHVIRFHIVTPTALNNFAARHDQVAVG